MDNLPLRYRYKFLNKFLDSFKSKEKKEAEAESDKHIDELLQNANEAWIKQTMNVVKSALLDKAPILDFFTNEDMNFNLFCYFVWGYVYESQLQNKTLNPSASESATLLTMLACVKIKNLTLRESQVHALDLDRAYNADDKFFNALSKLGRDTYLNPSRDNLTQPLTKLAPFVLDKH